MAAISVIVPVYGVEKYLRECLDSILAQTFSDLEIILINDGSKDSCPQIINEYAKKDKRIIAIHKENGGYGSACNAGLNRAIGDYISIIEPDDYIDKNMFEDLYKIAKDFDSDIVKSGFFDNLQTKTLVKCSKVIWDNDKIPANRSFTIKECSLFLYYHPSIWSCIYKREFIEKYKIRFIEATGSGWTDNPFQVQTMCLAEKINYTSNAYYYWRRVNVNESDDLKDYSIPFKRTKEIHDWLKKNNINDENILLQLARREIAYINIVLGNDNKDTITNCEYEIRQLLANIPEEKFLESKYVRRSEKRTYKSIKKNLKLHRFKILFRKYRKKFISFRWGKTEKRIIFCNKIYNFNSIPLNMQYYNLCFASDEKYAQHLCCALKSIFANRKNNEAFNIVILNDNISLKTQKYIIKMLTKGSTVEFIDIDENFFKDCPLTKETFHINSLTTYYRFILPSVCKYDKILYLDCDIIANASLEELYKTNIDDYYIAGVEDSYVDENCKRLNLNKYVNAGVLLVNLKKWRDDNIQEKLFNWAKENKESILWVDQDVINVVLQNKILYLQNLYNAQISELEFGKTKEFNKLVNNATIVHYVGHKKPWSDFGFKLNKYYYTYLNLLNGAFDWKIKFYRSYFKFYKRKILRLKISTKNTYITILGRTLYKNNGG